MVYNGKKRTIFNGIERSGLVKEISTKDVALFSGFSMALVPQIPLTFSSTLCASDRFAKLFRKLFRFPGFSLAQYGLDYAAPTPHFVKSGEGELGERVWEASQLSGCEIRGSFHGDHLKPFYEQTSYLATEGTFKQSQTVRRRRARKGKK